MNPSDVCELRLDNDTLSAWRDRLLTPDREAQIATHIPSCAICRRRTRLFERVARDLIRMPEPHPGDRIVRGVLARISSQEQRTMISPSRQIWRGAGVLAALSIVAAFVLFFAVVLHNQAGHTSGPTPIASNAPSATSAITETPGAPTPIVTATQAWGANAATTFTTTIDSSHNFQAGGVSADGQTLFGIEVTPGNPAYIGANHIGAGTYMVAHKTFTAFSFNPPSTPLPEYASSCCLVSGRYAMFTVQTQPGAACSPCHLAYYIDDLQTKATHQLVDPNSADQGIMPIPGLATGFVLSQGDLLVTTGSGAYRLVNLSTGTFAALPVPVDPGKMPIIDFNWPYLVYGAPLSQSSHVSYSTLHIYDLQTGVDVVIHPPAAQNHLAAWQPLSSHSSAAPSPAFLSGIFGGAITGDTLFFFAQNTAAITLYEVDHVMTAGAQPQPVATLANRHDGSSVATSLANDRLVLTDNGLAWDRVQKRFVQIAPTTPQANQATMTYLNGNALLLATTSTDARSGQPSQITLYDTATLPSS